MCLKNLPGALRSIDLDKLSGQPQHFAAISGSIAGQLPRQREVRLNMTPRFQRYEVTILKEFFAEQTSVVAQG